MFSSVVFLDLLSKFHTASFFAGGGSEGPGGVQKLMRQKVETRVRTETVFDFGTFPTILTQDRVPNVHRPKILSKSEKLIQNRSDSNRLG